MYIGLRKLFECAVGGFYAVTLSRPQWKVSTGTVLRWPTESKTSQIDAILPTMKTDIVLEYRPSGRKIVIDTKFTSLITEGWYRPETLHSGYVYQIYAYLRSQVASESRRRPTEGLLLHPSVGKDIDEAVQIQGHKIRFATVDLAVDPTHIRRNLLRVVNESVLN